jgi:N-dimethylarginine dimethylaminohydrolase
MTLTASHHGLAAATLSRARTRDYLMCPPTYFAVNYRINPWMHPDEPVDVSRAVAQWRRLHDTLIDLGHRVQLIEPHPQLPDMVFAANGGILIGDRALVPRFRYAERGPEADCFRTAFAALAHPSDSAPGGLHHVATAAFVNEGEGDFRVVGGRILAGTGLRSEPRAAAEAATFFDRSVVPLTLVDPRLYHLDTALAVLDERTVLYWPGAFDAASQARLRQLYPNAVLADESDATALALNLISDGGTVVMAPGHERLAGQIRERGFDIIALPTDELRKAGGGAKCCVLEWHERPDPQAS